MIYFHKNNKNTKSNKQTKLDLFKLTVTIVCLFAEDLPTRGGFKPCTCVSPLLKKGI